MNSVQIGAKYGIGESTVRHQLKARYGAAYRPTRRRTQHADWDAIWADYQDGLSSLDLGNKYEISDGRVREGLNTRYGQAYRTLARVREQAIVRPPVEKMQPRGTILGLRLSSGATMRQLATELGISVGALRTDLRFVPEYYERREQMRDRRQVREQLLQEGANTAELVDIGGFGHTTIYRWREQNDPTHRPNFGTVPEWLAVAWEYYCADHSLQQVCDEFGLNRTTLRKWFRRIYGPAYVQLSNERWRVQ